MKFMKDLRIYQMMETYQELFLSLFLFNFHFSFLFLSSLTSFLFLSFSFFSILLLSFSLLFLFLHLLLLPHILTSSSPAQFLNAWLFPASTQVVCRNKLAHEWHVVYIIVYTISTGYNYQLLVILLNTDTCIVCIYCILKILFSNKID